MPDPVLPQIRVTDSQIPEGSAGASAGVDSPSTTTDGGQSQRPKSSTSSEGNHQSNGKKLPASPVRNPSSKDANGAKPSSPPLPERPSTAIDPLSIHILKRTNTENTIPQKLRNTAGPPSPNIEIASPISPEIGSPRRQLTPEIVRSDSNPAKEKKKGVSFLSRFAIIGGKKKDYSSDVEDNESEFGDHRPEGMNAHVFSSSIGANGYIPQHKEPPRYIKVRAHHKKVREFDRMFLAQELSGTKHASSDEKEPGLTSIESNGGDVDKPSKQSKTSEAIWTTEFSKDGRYLAAAGRDMVVRVWAVISTPDERQSHEHEEDASSTVAGGERLSAPVFMSKPVREFKGHTGEILDLSWSKNNFLLSSSMDKTVRLWHMSRPDALVTFKHKDFVTSIAFHPRDDRFFLAGSLDSILRLWSIPDKSVAYWAQLPDLITAVAFTPDGKTAMAGVLSGQCLFYETEGLKYQAQIHVRSSRGKNAKGRKVTGIRAITYPPGDPNGEVKVLITTNDSRVRIYNLKDKALETKLRGHENTCSQIRASFSDDAQYVITGSEDKRCYIWTMGPSDSEKRPMEVFEAHSDIVTSAIMAPTQTRRLLAASGDPIYDLCNPPPVTLLSREESYRTGSEKRHSDPVSEPNVKKPEESPAYLARSAHTDGGILVTADHQGCIKVYRCDCAFKKRRSDNWETASMRKIMRSGSIMTKTSGGSHSRRNSVTQNYFAPHIESWRNAITDDGGSVKSAGMTSRDDRSISPGKFTNRTSFVSHSTSNSQNNLASASAARQQPYASNPVIAATGTPSVSTTSPPPSIYKATSNSLNNNYPSPPTPSFSFQSAKDEEDPLRLDAAARSNNFWNITSWKNQLNRDPSKLEAEGLKPPIDRGGSFVSKLSSDEGSGELTEDELTCKKCSSKDFRAKRTVKGLVMVCKSCGAMVE